MADTNLSLIDLKALSEPACKLIDAVKDAVGVLYEPTRLRRKARAEVDAAVIKLEGGAELEEAALRAAERIKKRELRRQINIESVVSEALDLLPDKVTDEALDEDWIAQFFNHCQDVSGKELQSLWSKLLAGEVAAPGSYSLRTLNLVKMLNKSDAELFTRLCCFAWAENEGGSLKYHLWTNGTDLLLEEKGLLFEDFLKLQHLGLIYPSSKITSKGSPFTLSYYGQVNKFIYLDSTDPVPTLDTFALTDVGQELSLICGSNADEEYLDVLRDSLDKEKSVIMKQGE